MISLLPQLRRHFDPLQDHLDCFCRYGVQLEGWFKGELLVALDHMRRDGIVTDFDREVRVANKRVDFCVDLAGRRHWVELKFWLIGSQQGVSYRPAFYFSDRTSVGISRDVAALQSLFPSDPTWLLILTAAKPSTEEWSKDIVKHNAKFNHSLIPRTSPDDFPTSYFLGLLEIGRTSA